MKDELAELVEERIEQYGVPDQIDKERLKKEILEELGNRMDETENIQEELKSLENEDRRSFLKALGITAGTLAFTSSALASWARWQPSSDGKSDIESKQLDSKTPSELDPNYNRIVMSPDGTTESFFMDSTTTSMRWKVTSSSFIDSSFPPIKINVDKDTIFVADEDTSPGKIIRSSPFGKELSNFDTEGSTPQDVDLDSNNSIWSVDNSSGRITEYKLDSTVVTSFSTSGGAPIANTVDSSDCVWVLEDSSSTIIKYRQDSSIVTSFSSPSNTPRGIDTDSSDCIWMVDRGYAPGVVAGFDHSSSLVTSFRSPSDITQDVAVDNSDCVWVCEYATDQVINFKQDSSVVTSFTVSDTNNNAIAVSPDDNCVWVTNLAEDDVEKYDQNGSLIESFSSNGTPRGVAAGAPSELSAVSSKNSSVINLQSGLKGETLKAKKKDNVPGSIWILEGVPGSSIGVGKVREHDRDLSLVTSFNSPGEIPAAVDFDSNNSLWLVDGIDNPFTRGEVFEFDQTGTSFTNFDAPSRYPGGLAMDSTGSIWVSDSDYQEVVVGYDQSGNSFVSFSAPSDVPTALDIDSSDCVWLADSGGGSDPGLIVGYDKTGNSFSNFGTPSSGVTGIALDSSDCIWVVDDTSDKIVGYDQTGSSFTSFSLPGTGSGKIDVDSSDSLWFEYEKSLDSYSVAKFDQAGNKIKDVEIQGEPIYDIAVEPDTPVSLKRFRLEYEK